MHLSFCNQAQDHEEFSLPHNNCLENYHPQEVPPSIITCSVHVHTEGGESTRLNLVNFKIYIRVIMYKDKWVRHD